MDPKESEKRETVFSTAKSIDTSRLSKAGQVLVRNRDKVIESWIHRVRSEVRDAKNLNEPILVDTLPAYIDNLAEALSPDKRSNSVEFTTLAEEHGGERARLTFYDPDALIREYQIFKDIVFSILETETTLSKEERLIINQSVDAGLREAAISFALVQANIREQFIATLTHDLRNPIGVVRMAAEILKNESLNKGETDELIDRIIDNAERADGMITDLLDATVVKSGGRLQLQLCECDIFDVVLTVAREFNIAHRNRIKVIGHPIRGFWSEKGLRRALENLCTNAIKYGDDSAPIVVTINDFHGRMLLNVHNEGPPIPPEEQETIFQVFRRTNQSKNENKKGWGLGLALVRGVAEAHGGSLAVDSKEGRGTTFTLDIPVDARPYQNAPVTG